MVTLLDSVDKMIQNSMFGVEKTKNVSERLISAAVLWNILFNPALSPIYLPSFDVFVSLFFDGAAELHQSVCDLSKSYRHLNALSGLVSLLCLPKIQICSLHRSSSAGYHTPRLTCVPMGSRFAVRGFNWRISHHFVPYFTRLSGAWHLPVLFRQRFNATRVFGKHNLTLPYIADVSKRGIPASSINHYILIASPPFAKVNLHTDMKKTISDSETPYNITIGLSWWTLDVLTALRFVLIPLGNPNCCLSTNTSFAHPSFCWSPVVCATSNVPIVLNSLPSFRIFLPISSQQFETSIGLGCRGAPCSIWQFPGQVQAYNVCN